MKAVILMEGLELEATSLQGLVVTGSQVSGQQLNVRWGGQNLQATGSDAALELLQSITVLGTVIQPV